MIRRHLEGVLRKRFRAARSVLLVGARQTGKTTLARAAFPGLPYSSLEDPDQLRFASEDPRGYLARFPRGAVLDEVQRLPALASYLQGVIDRGGAKFVLTGSQNFLLMERVTQSLAGRLSILTLPPLTQAEIDGRPAWSAARLFRASGKGRTAAGEALLKRILRGGYPEPVTRPAVRDFWFSDYVQTYVEKDIRQVLNVRDTLAFSRFLSLCAGRSGQLLNQSALASDAGISPAGAGHWLSVLRAGGLVYLLPPYHENFNKRVIKAPKLYFMDTGLLCRLLSIRRPEELDLHPLAGPIFETYVVSEVRKALLNQGEEPEMYFWRDQHGLEVDLLLRVGADWRPVEIKRGATPSGDDLKGVRLWRALRRRPDVPGCLLHGGSESWREQGVLRFPAAGL